VIGAAVAPFGVGLALAVGAVAYLVSAVTGWMAERETPAEVAKLRREAGPGVQVSGP
jgi:hypothetical protein